MKMAVPTLILLAAIVASGSNPWLTADLPTRWEAVGMAVIAVLTLELYWRIWRRSRRGGDETQWTGHAIDVTGIVGGVERVRRDFVGASRARLYETNHARGLLASARKLIAQLPYFRRQNLHRSDVGMTNDEAHE